MGSYKEIERKIRQFIVKYYTNELIKGTILFLSLGFLYLFFTLFLEYFLWLKPTARTFLFWIFILVEVFLLVRFILVPIFKLVGLQNQISFTASSKIIGDHFPEVKDKLLNILQLKENSNQSDLILASIDQKSAELQPIPFVKAIDFKQNSKYLKYVIVPVLVWLIILFTGNKGMFTESLERVVNYKTAYNPPAPFTFFVVNDKLEVVQGKPFTVSVKTEGNVVPNQAKIVFDNQQYYLQNNLNGTFSYTFSEVNFPTDFYLESNGIQSQDFRIEVIKTPTISTISMQLNYPNYIGKRTEIIPNTGNAIIPEGTKITWNVLADQTEEVSFISKNEREDFSSDKKGSFEFSKNVRQNINYQISSSNIALKDYENLPFSIRVTKDEFPSINVKSNIDSISLGTAQFAGQLSDDYGISKLELIYYDEVSPENQQVYVLNVSRENVQTFFYNFPDGLNLKEGINYEIFFQVFDNDGVNGKKKATSRKFNYRQKTSEEIDEELLDEQKNTINSLENSIQNQKKQKEELEKIQLDLQNKKSINFNDKKKVENFIKRQEQYQKMMKNQTEKLQENLGEKKEENETIQDKKEELKKRIEELKKLDKQQKLLDEIQKMAEKLNKEDLLQKSKELAAQNKQKERSLERILELTKRFYVEQKTMQIANKLDELAKKQDSISNKDEKSLEEQKEINKEFENIEKELEELDKDNEKLKEPIELPDVEDEKESAKEEQKEAEKNLSEKKNAEAKKNQKKSSKKMKEMSAKMQKAMMDAGGDSIEENMEDLRKILENLVTFSFKQEQLMNKFGETSTAHPDFGKDLKRQNEIKTYFEHIDDSLYVLSMRLPKISAKINDDLALAHYNLDQSLENFSENRFSSGISNQRYVMTGANNLADYLSTILTNMKNSMSMSMGKGKSGDQEFSLPDLIEKQKGLGEKMKEGKEKGGKKPGEKPGDKEGKKPGEDGKTGKDGKSGENGGEGKDEKGGKENGEESENEDLNGELFKIYQEQSLLRQQLQDAILQQEQETGKPGNGDAKRALKTMEELENEILEKGFNAATLQKMQNLNYQLLKLDKAALQQGEDKKRKAKSSLEEIEKQKIKELNFKKLFYNQIEILNRQSLPLQQNYKKKVQEYFSEPEKK